MAILRIDEKSLFAVISAEEKNPEKVDRIAEAIKNFAKAEPEQKPVVVPESCTRHDCPVTRECLLQHGHDLTRGSRPCRDLLKRAGNAGGFQSEDRGRRGGDREVKSLGRKARNSFRFWQLKPV